MACALLAAAAVPGLTLPLVLTMVRTRPPTPPKLWTSAPPKPVITIFSMDTCRPCKAAKTIFDKLGMAYTDISITQFPHRRDDAFALIPPGVTTMPQIFFGEHHVGGASDLAELLKCEHTFQALYDAAEPTTDPRKRPTTDDEPPLLYPASLAAAYTSLPKPRRPPAAPAPTYGDYMASKARPAPAEQQTSPADEWRGVTVPTTLASAHGGKGFGGGEATRDPAPTPIDPNDPKAKQQAIHKAETFEEYLARRQAAQ